MYGSEVEGAAVKGRPLVKGENRVEEYIRKRGRGGLDQVRRECWNKENWKLFCRGYPLGGEFLEGMKH